MLQCVETAVLLVLVVVAQGCSLGGLYGAPGAPEGGVPGDASFADKGGDGCAATEDCSNGADDDCNGLTDCADPACATTGFTCTAGPIPMGWKLVAYSDTERPVCPPPFGNEQAIISNIVASPVTCGCTCGGTVASCEGSVYYYGYPDSCVSASQVNLSVNGGACAAINTSIVATHSYRLPSTLAPPAQQGTCTGTGHVASAPLPTFHSGATCTAGSPLGGGCSAGAACAPPTGSSFQACILHPGNVACPTFGFTQQTLASSGSPGYVDMRQCGACPCATSLSCGDATNVALFTSDDCTGAAAYNVGWGCGLASTNESIGSYEVAVPTSGSASCQATGMSPPTGAVTFDSNVETICCSP